jgi:hypothetical protein
LDSIQIVRHGDWFSGEFRHELILLRHDECSPLDGNLARCGRFPELFDCPSRTLRRMRECVKVPQWPWERRVRRVLSFRPEQCERNASACYLRDGGRVNETYWCPEGGG